MTYFTVSVVAAAMCCRLRSGEIWSDSSSVRGNVDRLTFATASMNATNEENCTNTPDVGLERVSYSSATGRKIETLCSDSETRKHGRFRGIGNEVHSLDNPERGTHSRKSTLLA